jgi:hypothetical protein
MLGKASEIKIQSFNYLEDYETWAENKPDAEIIDMKFQAEQGGSILLIIYKEDKPNDTETN